MTHSGWEEVAPHESYPQKGHPAYYNFNWADGRVLGEFCLSLISAGSGELKTEQGRQQIKAGEAMLYCPGEWHRHRPTPNVGWSNQWINFNGSLAHQWMSQMEFRLEKNRVLVSNRSLFAKQFRYLVRSVDAATGGNSRQFSWQAIGVISHFLTDARSTAAPMEKNEFGDRLVDAAMNFIWSQSHNQIGALEVAAHIGVSRRTLERRFQARSGTTLLDEIQRCRLSRAALLLRETNVPIKYILGRAGFPSHQRLRQVFRNEFGVSPNQYRRAHRGAL